MKKTKILPIAVLIVLTMLVIASAAYASPARSENFTVPLSGGDEVPARDTQARGVAIFHLSQDGTALDYKLNVANIDNVFAAHIHCGVLGANGPVGVTLFAGTPAGGRTDGT